MLAMTQNAANAVERIVSQPEVPAERGGANRRR